MAICLSAVMYIYISQSLDLNIFHNENIRILDYVYQMSLTNYIKWLLITSILLCIFSQYVQSSHKFNLPVSHFFPVYPGKQEHEKSLTRSAHVPPCSQGELEHSSTSVQQNIDINYLLCYFYYLLGLLVIMIWIYLSWQSNEYILL